MTDIVAVLVVPAAGDPGGLLAHGALGCRPPVALNADTCGHDGHRGWRAEHEVRGSCYMCQHPTAALPLWWNGALVPEGWDRARRSMYAGTAAVTDQSEPWCLIAPSLHDVLWAAARLASGQRLASRVVRLARVDGRLVEVEP